MSREGRDLYFITEYPTAIKPFYVMAKPDEPESSYTFDLEYKGDEMASGGQREHRYEVLLARMKEKGLNPENFEFYLKAFRYGMPPHGGWGFGLDRFVQKLLDLPNIREAILFPHDRSRLVP
jgi:aspartyl-tRNA synthetase